NQKEIMRSLQVKKNFIIKSALGLRFQATNEKSMFLASMNSSELKFKIMIKNVLNKALNDTENNSLIEGINNHQKNKNYLKRKQTKELLEIRNQVLFEDVH